MNEIVKVGSNNIPVIGWKGQRVITTAQLAEVYETDSDNIKKNFQNNKERFKEKEHYFCLIGDELKEFKNLVTDFPLVQKNTPKLYPWTRKGASRWELTKPGSSLTNWKRITTIHKGSCLENVLSHSR